jgi:hypothetical protein
MTEMAQLLTQVKLLPKFNNVSEQDKKFVQKIVQDNIMGKLDSYLKKVLTGKQDAEVSIKYTISYHEESKKYDADLIFKYDGSEFIYKKEGFKILSDLVNHAFQHFKETLSKK